LFMWVILARSTILEAPDWTVFSSHVVLPLFYTKILWRVIKPWYGVSVCVDLDCL
jgi:hypothetical protein